jgi:hypothetical protein
MADLQIRYTIDCQRIAFKIDSFNFTRLLICKTLSICPHLPTTFFPLFLPENEASSFGYGTFIQDMAIFPT